MKLQGLQCFLRTNTAAYFFYLYKLKLNTADGLGDLLAFEQNKCSPFRVKHLCFFFGCRLFRRTVSYTQSIQLPHFINWFNRGGRGYYFNSSSHLALYRFNKKKKQQIIGVSACLERVHFNLTCFSIQRTHCAFPVCMHVCVFSLYHYYVDVSSVHSSIGAMCIMHCFFFNFLDRDKSSHLAHMHSYYMSGVVHLDSMSRFLLLFLNWSMI